MTMDDPFYEIVNQLEIEEPHDLIDVSKLSIQDLLSQFDDINNRLFEMGQALKPSNQEARDLHSLRSAIYVEIQKRGKKK
jgi:hypothetical protein